MIKYSFPSQGFQQQMMQYRKQFISAISIKLTRKSNQLALEAFVKLGVSLVEYYISSVTDIVVIAHACHKIVDQVKRKWPGFFWLPVILPQNMFG